jgi:hypothetical protein
MTTIIALATLAVAPALHMVTMSDRRVGFFSVSDTKPSVVLVVSSVHREMSDEPSRYAVVSTVLRILGGKMTGRVRAQAPTARAGVESALDMSDRSSHDCTDPPCGGKKDRGPEV